MTRATYWMSFKMTTKNKEKLSARLDSMEKTVEEIMK